MTRQQAIEIVEKHPQSAPRISAPVFVDLLIELGLLVVSDPPRAGSTALPLEDGNL